MDEERVQHFTQVAIESAIAVLVSSAKKDIEQMFRDIHFNPGDTVRFPITITVDLEVDE